MLSQEPPRKSLPKNDKITIRMRTKHKIIIKMLAQRENLTIGEYFLTKILDNLTKEEREFIEREEKSIQLDDTSLLDYIFKGGY